jgi:hypothetical protein
MPESERIIYQPQFPSLGSDTARPFFKGPAVACHPDGNISLGNGLVIEELGIDEIRTGLFNCLDTGSAFGGQRVLNAEGKLLSWSVFLMPVIGEQTKATFREILSCESDINKRRILQTKIRRSLPHLVINPEEGISMTLQSGKRIEWTSEGVVVYEKNSQEKHDIEEGNFICVSTSEIFPSIPFFPDGEVEIGFDCSGTPEEIFTEVEDLLGEAGFNSSDERVFLEVLLREIVSPVVEIYSE